MEMIRWKKPVTAALAGLFLFGIIGAGTELRAFAQMTDAAQAAGQEAETLPPPAPVILAEGAITSCTIGEDRQTVTITAQCGGDMTGTDGYIYLFEMAPYEDELDGRADYLAWAEPGTQVWTTPLNRGTLQDKLYSRFAAAVYDGTRYIRITDPYYITNPEQVAKNTKPYQNALSKKGLNMEIGMLSDAFELGVNHTAVNIAFQQILGSGIDYTYDGKTYHFNKDVIAEYDRVINALSSKSITITAIILNRWNENTPDLVYPGTRKAADANYYLFNVATPQGFEQTRAIIAFLAERYDGSNPNYGKITHWVIGNEINNQIWNYTGPWDLDSYVRAYQKAFRVFYTAIKSVSAGDRVYFSLDYNWNNEIDGQLRYGGKNIVDTFNGLANRWGQIDWGLAYHPYPCPMIDPNFWDDDQTGLITEDYMSPVINFKNLHVLTDYFTQPQLLSPTGEVRSIILTEEGFTGINQQGEDISRLQAAAFAYSYYLVDSNPHIDAYILSRQVDAPSEVQMGLGFGLWTCKMDQPDQIVSAQRRLIWQVFRNIDQKKYTLENTEFAKSIIGIQKWSDVVPGFRWRSMEK